MLLVASYAGPVVQPQKNRDVHQVRPARFLSLPRRHTYKKPSVLPFSSLSTTFNLASIRVLEEPPINLFTQPHSAAIMSLHCTYSVLFTFTPSSLCDDVAVVID